MRTKIGEDPLGSPIYSECAILVNNVLIQPSSAEDISQSSSSLYGKREEYILHIPKNDEHDWEDAYVEFYGKRFRTIGPEKKYIGHLVPGNWDRNIKCERYE